MAQHVVITGASRGIGRAIALELAGKGYRLTLLSRQSRTELEQLQQEIKQKDSVSCDIFLCDVGNYRQVQQTFARIDTVDILINNAGMAHIGLLSDMEEEQWHRMISTNLDALFYTSKQVIPDMVRRKSGQIINISSVWGNVGASMEVAYSATKGGANSFTRALAKELAPSHIRVNAVAFGAIDTQMNACLTAEDRELLIQEIPADRLGTTQEAAKMVLQVMEAPEYLTGQVITMDGAW